MQKNTFFSKCARCHAVYVPAEQVYCSRCERLRVSQLQPRPPVSFLGAPRTVRFRLKAASLPWEYNLNELVKARLVAADHTVYIGLRNNAYTYEIHHDGNIVAQFSRLPDMDAARSRSVRHLARLLDLPLPELAARLKSGELSPKKGR